MLAPGQGHGGELEVEADSKCLGSVWKGAEKLPQEKFPWLGPLPLLQHPKALSWAFLPTVTPFLCKEHSHVGGRLRSVHVPSGRLASCSRSPTVGRGCQDT